MANPDAQQTLDIPVYATVMVYPNGSRNETDAVRFNAPCAVPFGLRDRFGFSFWHLAEVEDDDLEAVAEAFSPAPFLRDLNIGGCSQIGDRGLRHLAKFVQLEDLVMSGVGCASGRGLAVLGKLTQLVKLDLAGVENVGDDTLKLIARLTRLEELNFDNCSKITDAGIRYLSDLSELRSLGVNEANVTDLGLETIAGLRKLKFLNLSQGGRITDRGLARLGDLPELEHVNLPNCSGFLRRLLRGSGISRKGLRRFREMRPECYVWSQEIYDEQQRMLASLAE